MPKKIPGVDALKRVIERRKPAKKRSDPKKGPKPAGGPGKHWIPGMTPHDGYGIR